MKNAIGKIKDQQRYREYPGAGYCPAGIIISQGALYSRGIPETGGLHRFTPQRYYLGNSDRRQYPDDHDDHDQFNQSKTFIYFHTP